MLLRLRHPARYGETIFLASQFRFLNSRLMPKWVKMLVAIALLPLCFGAGRALWMVIQHIGSAGTTWVPLLAGAACWVVVYLMLPKPMWIYVLGHELTHALWAWLFGAEVRRLKVTSKGGHVLLTKTNFLIALAPYFFPLYAVLVVLAFLLGRLIWDWHFLALFHLFLGAAYGFHVTLTAHILKTRQTDITEQGYLFSAVVIFLGNISVLLLGIPLLASKVGVATAMGWWLECTGEVFHRIGQLI